MDAENPPFMTHLGSGVCIAVIETMLIWAGGVAIPVARDMMPMSRMLAKLTPGLGCRSWRRRPYSTCGDTRR